MPLETLLIDPRECRLWSALPRGHRRLDDTACADLIDSIRSQGQQEIPAIVRALPDHDTHRFEIICGARRHYAVRHLRDTGVDIGFLVTPRDLSDEAAFRLADLENRNRSDISEHDRACAYAAALEAYYDGVQARMAEQMGVRRAWLSRYLQMARVPDAILAAFRDPAEMRERHARAIMALMGEPEREAMVMAKAAEIAAGQTPLSPAAVVKALKASVAGTAKPRPGTLEFRRSPHDRPITMHRRSGRITLSFDADLREGALRGAFDQFITSVFR